MKGRAYMDLGSIFDEIFDAAQNFQDELHNNFHRYGNGFPGGRPFEPFGKAFFDENTDFYPNYSYPPMNIYMSGDLSLSFEFALAGFEEKDISLSFQGDYMVFSAAAPVSPGPSAPDSPGFDASSGDGESRRDGGQENLHYIKRRLKIRDIEKQKYYVPLDKYAQEKVRAVFKNGILKVTIPPKDEPEQNEGIKIEIVKEGV
ncbi:MAG: Hsp20/alpha crystallin family protein [Treponema sp.]|jgi:HSP20 family molecular chaperone IbpA|nr:Hsp20/alpha crystallin family protein [Treponema sp.]